MVVVVLLQALSLPAVTLDAAMNDGTLLRSAVPAQSPAGIQTAGAILYVRSRGSHAILKNTCNDGQISKFYVEWIGNRIDQEPFDGLVPGFCRWRPSDSGLGFRQLTGSDCFFSVHLCFVPEALMTVHDELLFMRRRCDKLHIESMIAHNHSVMIC